MARTRRDPATAAAGIVASAIDRTVEAVDPDDHEGMSDDETVAAASRAWLADAAVALIAVTEFAYGMRSGQLDAAQASATDAAPPDTPPAEVVAMVQWTVNSASPCQECEDRAAEDPVPADDADPDGLHPGCGCSWEPAESETTTAAAGPLRITRGGLDSGAVTGEPTQGTLDASLTASAVKVHHTETTTGTWSAADNVKNLDNGDGEAEYKQAAAWQNPDADPDTKAAYSFWHHLVASDGTVGDASTVACSSAVAVLNGGRGVDVKAQDWYPDRDGIYSHVVAHLKDSGVEDKDLPKLDDMKVVGVRQAMKADGMDDLAAMGDPNAPQWHGIGGVEGVWTPGLSQNGKARPGSTGARSYAPGAFTWRDLPMMLVIDHEGAMMTVGRVDSIERDTASRLIMSGVWDDGELGQQVATWVANGTLRWMSAEPDETYESMLVYKADGTPFNEWDEIEPNTEVEELVTNFRICAMSVVKAGALEDCVICPIDVPLPAPPVVSSLAASATVAVVKDENPPLEWFSNPNRNGKPGSDIHEAGAYLHVEGYIAKWGVPHIGRTDRMCAPRSGYPNYPYFRQCGHVLTAGGKVPTGGLTMGCGHAGDYLSADEARAFYDNTGRRWAAVAAGEDEHGIWASGMCKPDLSKAELWSARASAWSGDWRPIGGALELVASLNVNVPGFPQADPALMASAGADVIVLPTERTRCAMRGGEPMSLVAAGVSFPDPVGDALRALSAKVADLEHRLSPQYRAAQAEAEAKVAERRAALRRQLQPVG